MKAIALLAALAVSALAAKGGVEAIQDFEKPIPDDNHEWLQQLVGEWTAIGEATMGPGAEPMRLESTESVRSIGGLWIMAEGSAMFGDMPFTSILTLGFDPKKDAFIGTWIDTMQTHMWSYTGSLDAARKVLTLETEGPSMVNPTTTCNFRDVIEIVSPDHKVMTSSMKGEDGTWESLMRVDYRRKN